MCNTCLRASPGKEATPGVVTLACSIRALGLNIAVSLSNKMNKLLVARTFLSCLVLAKNATRAPALPPLGPRVTWGVDL